MGLGRGGDSLFLTQRAQCGGQGSGEEPWFLGSQAVTGGAVEEVRVVPLPSGSQLQESVVCGARGRSRRGWGTSTTAACLELRLMGS